MRVAGKSSKATSASVKTEWPLVARSGPAQGEDRWRDDGGQG